MDRTERFHVIDQMLNQRRHVTREQFLEALEVSPATFKRDLEYLRDRLAAPIVWDAELRGYRYDIDVNAEQYQLPGLWFNTGEIQALLTMDALLTNLQPGMLSDHIEPLRTRVRMLLDKGDHSIDQIKNRIRIMQSTAKPYSSDFFQVICQALLSRKQLDLVYYSRQIDSESHRTISPQRLIYYRDNWYLDAWCHWRSGLRSFAIDAIRQLHHLQQDCHEVSESTLNAELESGYGIFSGVAENKAVLKFSPHVARWVSREQWHPDQAGEYDEGGNYWLTIPYSQDTELIMDVLRHGADVEVMQPPLLRRKLEDQIRALAKRYKLKESS